jgi:hypothetical protein
MVTLLKAGGPRRKNMVGLTADLPAAAMWSTAQDHSPRQVRTRHTAVVPLVVKLAAANPAARS